MMYLIDSSIYIFRAWQTWPDSITNTFGEPANAVFGFADMLAKILSTEHPEYIVCAFDHSHKTGERYSIYSEYKANRPEAPPELQIQFDRCLQAAKAFDLPAFGSQRVEADDIIGSIAYAAHDEQMPVTIISADKDLTQFIREGDVYWNYARNLRQNSQDIEKRFKLRPEQIADMLALCGDKVDNIPGVPGVGQTTAARLLKKWKTLDGVLDNVEQINGMQFRGAPRIAKLVDEHRDNIAIARELTGLIHDPQLTTTPSMLKRKKIDADTIQSALQTCGFNEPRAQKLAIMSVAKNSAVKKLAVTPSTATASNIAVDTGSASGTTSSADVK